MHSPHAETAPRSDDLIDARRFTAKLREQERGLLARSPNLRAAAILMTQVTRAAAVQRRILLYALSAWGQQKQRQNDIKIHV